MHFLTRTGAQAVLRHLDGMAYVVVLFALYTGLRFGEIAGLDVRDLDLDAEVPTVQVRRHGRA
jgi:integrase